MTLEEINKKAKVWNVLQWVIFILSALVFCIGLGAFIINKSRLLGPIVMVCGALMLVTFFIVDHFVIKWLNKENKKRYNALSVEDKMRENDVVITIRNDEAEKSVDKLLNGETVNIDLHKNNTYQMNAVVEIKLVKDN